MGRLTSDLTNGALASEAGLKKSKFASVAAVGNFGQSTRRFVPDRRAVKSLRPLRFNTF